MPVAFGRSLGDFANLSNAETALIAAAARGEMLTLADHRSETPPPQGSIRATLLRFLLLGGDELTPVHELGPQVAGAVISGELDLTACTVTRPLKLDKCWLAGKVTLDNATTPTLNFQGSRLAGMSGDGASVKGDLFVCSECRSDGPIRIVGAKIDGDFDGTESEFVGGDALAPKAAITLDSTVIGARLNLYNASFVGAVRLNSADIKGDADLSNIRVVGCAIADLDPTLPPETRYAIVMHRAQVGGRLYLTQLGRVFGQIRLIYAHCAVLVDDEQIVGRAGCSDLLLDGFTYDRIYTTSPTGPEMREKWLSQPAGAAETRFRPQPWLQLAKVLREMGDEEAAIRISVAREDRRRRSGGASHFVKSVHFCYGLFNAYGYRPQRVLNYFFWIWLVGGVIYCAAKERQGIVQIDPSKPAAAFDPWIFSLDTTIPFVNFGQTKEWRANVIDPATAPSVKKTPPGSLLGIDAGRFAYWTGFVQTLFGWLGGISLLAFLNRLSKRE